MASRVWEAAKRLGVEDTLSDDHYVCMIAEGRVRNQEARNKGVTNIGVP